MGNKRSDKALTELALIEMRSHIERNQIGYWDHLRYEMNDSAFRLQRVMSTQTPEIAAELQSWGEKWGIQITHGGYRPGAGRPQAEDIKKSRSFKATDSEWEQIQKNATDAGYPNASEYIRAMTLEGK